MHVSDQIFFYNEIINRPWAGEVQVLLSVLGDDADASAVAATATGPGKAYSTKAHDPVN